MLSVVCAIAVEPDPPCSEVAACGPDWVGMVETGLAAGLLYWLARLPELALIAAPALAVIVAWVELPGAGWMSPAANGVVIVVLGFGWATARERFAYRTRQRLVVERAAGVRHQLPQPVRPLRRGVILIAAGLLLCAVAVGAVTKGLVGIRADEQHAARATHVTGTVVYRREESVETRTDDARSITLDSAYPEEYRVGSTMTVLEDGPWRRLAADPYDAFGWQLLTLAAALPGLTLVIMGVVARRRAAALRRAPVPTLRVLQRTDHDGRTWVYATDDTSGRAPFFACSCAPVAPEGEEVAEEERSAPGEPEFPVFDTRLRPHRGTSSTACLASFTTAFSTDSSSRRPSPFPSQPRLSQHEIFQPPIARDQRSWMTACFRSSSASITRLVKVPGIESERPWALMTRRSDQVPLRDTRCRSSMRATSLQGTTRLLTKVRNSNPVVVRKTWP
ncbi:hypothetical protein ACWCQ0_39185 [Streptomyces massasporeus]|uniref:hypothetical protein n=1 Tax=Streptomyces massasporeus TaxID=67324 RepID=UPI0033C355A3